MATRLRPMASSRNLRSESGIAKHQSLMRAVHSQRKRQSRDSSILYPDPFRYGDPNPLNCHPHFNDKRPEFISRPCAVGRPLSFPVLYSSSGPCRLSLYGQDDLDAYRAQGFVPRLLRNESLVTILEFFEKNTLTRATSPSLVRHHPDTSFQKQVKIHEAATAQREVDEKRSRQNCNIAPDTSSLTPSEEASDSGPDYRSAIDDEASIKICSCFALSKRWKAGHHQRTAFTETHAPLKRDSEISSREPRKQWYAVKQAVLWLKNKLGRLRSVVS